MCSTGDRRTYVKPGLLPDRFTKINLERSADRLDAHVRGSKERESEKKVYDKGRSIFIS